MGVEKIVNFDQYCPKCKHFKVPPTEEPCNECLSNPVQEFSHKPMKFKPSDKNKEVRV